jgi:hypothetical protein
MLSTLHVASIFFVSIAWAQSLAHALELPGKLRLDKKSYIAVQGIYYPGFTIAGGFGEGLGMLTTLVLLLMTSTKAPGFFWILLAMLALVLMHAVYWVITHPVNKFWMKDQELKGLGGGFFAIGKGRDEAAGTDPDEIWKRLRDRWERSHAIRAVFAGIALVALSIAAVI